MNDTQKFLTLKGSLFTMTAIQLTEMDLEHFGEKLLNTVNQSPKFFQHAPIILDIQQLEQSTRSIDFPALIKQLRQYQIIPVGIRGGNDLQKKLAIEFGLAVFPSDKHTSSQQQTVKPVNNQNAAPSEKKIEKKVKVEVVKNKTLLITQPVRSGQRIYAKQGDLIITAPVSHGAEILADGNIHVYGPLRGRALAGVNGDVNARIFCQHMEAQLIAIAGRYLVNEQVPKSDPAVDSHSITQVFLENGRININKI